ncbi:hypothetical protein PIB30_079773 [Stylosanthes scabra]|uniref:Uncharacterized protein n=1 Tax=Stylosanthes scabra TaxID=79078 RepID=A0ABU6SRA9_9FABA|nr:hypothetical protein [Stylosanthes scabra]
MREKRGAFGFTVQTPSRGRAVPRARACHAMGAQKHVVMGSRGRAALPGPFPRAPSARAQTHQGHCTNVRAVRVRQERGAAAPCYLVASSECGQAHRAGATRPSYQVIYHSEVKYRSLED